MSLSVEVGMLADLLESDEDGVEWLRAEFRSVNEVLGEHRLPCLNEPEEMPPIHNRSVLYSFPCRDLHYLRRFAGYVAEYPGWIAKPFSESCDPTDDPILQKHSQNLVSHLICHSDCEGFYFPIQFKLAIMDEKNRITGGVLGSSYALLSELQPVGSALGIRLENGVLSDAEVDKILHDVEVEAPLSVEKGVWLTLFEAARLSIEYKTAICFS